jgi:rhodanese-related sulfurtransferase
MAASITVSTLRNKISDKANICVIDVRRKADFEKSPEMITGATWKDPEKVEEWSKTVPQNQDLIVYCVKGGSVSQSVADTLQKSHPHVKYLQGGILSWQTGEK